MPKFTVKHHVEVTYQTEAEDRSASVSFGQDIRNLIRDFIWPRHPYAQIKNETFVDLVFGQGRAATLNDMLLTYFGNSPSVVGAAEYGTDRLSQFVALSRNTSNSVFSLIWANTQDGLVQAILADESEGEQYAVLAADLDTGKAFEIHRSLELIGDAPTPSTDENTRDRMRRELAENGCTMYAGRHIHQGEVGPYVVTDGGTFHVPDLDHAIALIEEPNEGADEGADEDVIK